LWPLQLRNLDELELCSCVFGGSHGSLSGVQMLQHYPDPPTIAVCDIMGNFRKRKTTY
jgi:hypothetical protein